MVREVPPVGVAIRVAAREIRGAAREVPPVQPVGVAIRGAAWEVPPIHVGVPLSDAAEVRYH